MESGYPSCTDRDTLYTEAQVSVYANRAGAQGGTNNWVYTQTIAALRLNRLFYGKSKQPCKGTPLLADCGTTSNLTSGVGSAIAKASPGVAGAGIGAAGALGVIGTGTAAIAGAATAGAGLLLIPILAIFQHHAQAVATEQQTLCQAASDWNGFADAMEAALSQGKIPLEDALAQLRRAYQSILSTVQGIEKPINAAYGMHKTVDAIYTFNSEVVYPSLISAIPGLQGVQSAISSVVGADAAKKIVSLPGAAIIGAGAVLAYKVF